MNQLIKLTTYIIILFTAGIPFAQQQEIPASLYPEVESSVDQSEMTIGDIFHLKVKLTYDPSVTVVNPTAKVDLGQFEVKDINPGLTQTTEDGKKQRTITFTLSTYFTGEFEIPPFNIDFRTESGQTGQVRTAPIRINVNPITPEDSEDLDIKDIKPQATLAGLSRLPMILTIAGIILLLIVIGYWLWKRWTRPKEGLESTVKLSPQEQALQALAALRENREYIENKLFQDFSFRVSEILRNYIQQRWGIPAMDETSHEIVSNLDRVGVSANLLTDFQSFFEGCDLIKFAKHEPQDEEMTELIDQAENIVKATPFMQTFPEETQTETKTSETMEVNA